MASVHCASWRKQSHNLSTSNFIIGWITAVSMPMVLIISWLTTRTVISPRHIGCLPSLCCAMLSSTGKRTKVFIWKLPSQSWKRTDLIVRTTSVTRVLVVRTHPAALQWVSSCNLPCRCRHLWIHHQYLQYTPRELPTEGAYKHSCYSEALDPTGREPGTCCGHYCGSSACWLCYSSWLIDVRSGAWGAWERKHWPKHPDRQQLHGWSHAFRDARGQRGLRRCRWRKRRRPATDLQWFHLGTSDVDE